MKNYEMLTSNFDDYAKNAKEVAEKELNSFITVVDAVLKDAAVSYQKVIYDIQQLLSY